MDIYQKAKELLKNHSIPVRQRIHEYNRLHADFLCKIGKMTGKQKEEAQEKLNSLNRVAHTLFKH